MNSQQLTELLLQSLEHERGGVKGLPEAPFACAQREDLRSEWEKYLSQTEEHVATLTRVCEVFEHRSLHHDSGHADRQSARRIADPGDAGSAGPRAIPAAAQIVAAECVVHAETKDHLNWELIGELAKKEKGDAGKALKEAHERSKMKRTSTSITLRAGVVSCGWSRSASTRSSRLPKKNAM